MKTLIFHSDPGHGWLEVHPSDLAEVGLKPADFSSYSYAKGSTLYLEEDCDASKFVEAYIAKFGAKPTFKESYQTNTFIRNLPCNNAGKA